MQRQPTEYEVSIRFATDKREWDGFIQSCPTPHITQAFAYGEGKAATGWTPRRVVLLMSGRPVAIALVLELRRLGVRLISRVNRGPLFLDSNPPHDLVVSVYAALRRRWGRFGVLLIAPALHTGAEALSQLRDAGYRQRNDDSWSSGHVDLTRDEDTLWKSFNSTFRNRVRGAEKAGARLRIAQDPESFAWMIERHRENMAEKTFDGVDPTMLREMMTAAPEDLFVFQLLAEDKPAAGMLVMRFGRVAEYFVGWFGPEGRKLNAGNFLMWNVMREMKKHGALIFDVGGMSAGNGYSRFKRTMNPIEYTLAHEWMSWI